MGAYVYPVDNWQTTDGTKYTGRRLRQMFGAMFYGKTPTRPLGARTGVVAGTPTVGSSATVTASATTWTCRPHAGVLDVQGSSIAGAYTYSLDDVRSGDVTGADANNPRTDIIYVQLNDPTEGGSNAATPGIDFLYLAGVPGGSTPATPARSLALARINVPKLNGGAPTVTWLAPFTVALGGVLPVSAGVRPASPYVGQYIDDAAVGLLRWDGSDWSEPPLTWVDVPAVSATYASTLQVAKRNGMVFCRGNITKTTGSFSGTSVTTVANLPAGYEPADLVRASLYGYLTGTGAPATMHLQISTGQTGVGLAWMQVGSFTAAYFTGMCWPAATP